MRGQRVEEGALAVGAGAVEEEQRVLAGRAGQAVAGDAPKEALQVIIAGGHLIEEPLPARAFSVAGRDRGHLRAQRRPVVRARLAGAQVDDAVGRIQRPRVGIPVVGCGRMPGIGARKIYHRGHRLGAGDELAIFAAVFSSRCCERFGGLVAAQPRRENTRRVMSSRQRPARHSNQAPKVSQ